MTPDHPDCTDTTKRCPWGPSEWRDMGDMQRALKDQEREIGEIKGSVGEIKNSVNDTNSQMRAMGAKIDRALLSGGNGKSVSRLKSTGITVGSAGAGGGIIYGVIECVRMIFKAHGGG